MGDVPGQDVHGILHCVLDGLGDVEAILEKEVLEIHLLDFSLSLLTNVIGHCGIEVIFAASDSEAIESFELSECGHVLDAVLARDVAQLHKGLPNNSDGIIEENSSDGLLFCV